MTSQGAGGICYCMRGVGVGDFTWHDWNAWQEAAWRAGASVISWLCVCAMTWLKCTVTHVCTCARTLTHYLAACSDTLRYKVARFLSARQLLSWCSSQRSKNKPVIVHRPFGHHYTPASSLFAHLKRGQKAVNRSPRAENWTKHKNKTAASERLSSVEERSHTHKCLRHSRVSAKVKRKHTAVLFCRSSDSTVTEIKTWKV